MPYGDVFIHAGDFTELGLPSEVKKFNDWLGETETNSCTLDNITPNTLHVHFNPKIRVGC